MKNPLYLLTSVAIGGVLVLAVVYFYLPKYGGKYWFKGPVSTIDSSDPQQVITNASENEEKGENSSENGKSDN